MRIPIEILRNRKRIMGIMHLPSKFVGEKTFVVLCYGMNGNRVEANRIFVKVADYFENKGIAFVRFDYLGLGISDGEFFEADLDTKVLDVISVVNYIRNCHVNEKCRIVLMGISDGAKVINKIMSENLIEIDDVILLNPVLALNKSEVEAEVEENAKKSLGDISVVKHPALGKIAILNVGQFFSPKHMKQCSVDQDVFDVTDKNLICFFSAKDDLSFVTRNMMEKKACEIKEIASHSHVFVEKEAQSVLSEEAVNWILNLGEEGQ